MIKLNYNNLDGETQDRLVMKSKQEIENRYGKDLKIHALENGLNYLKRKLSEISTIINTPSLFKKKKSLIDLGDLKKLPFSF